MAEQKEGKEAEYEGKVEAEGTGGEGKEGQDDAGRGEEEREVVIRFLIQPEGFPHFVAMPRSSTVAELKAQVAQDLELPPEAMSLSGSGLEERDDLRHLALGVEHEVTLVIHSDIAEASTRYKLPSEIDVVVHFDDEDVPSRTIRVAIVREDRERGKPYFGGFRNTKTGVVFHHAATQKSRTPPKNQDEVPRVKYTRESQTAVLVARSAQTVRENGTQMARPDLYIDGANDVFLEPKEYFDSAQLHALRIQCTLTIQRFWRGYLARRRAQRLRDERQQRIAEQKALRARQEAEEKQQHEREVERRMKPRTTSDFEVLYNELENWRQHETTRIKSTEGLSEAQRKAQLEELLHKETKLLQTIDRLKITASEENRKKRIDKILHMMAAPKKWQMADGDVTLVHTPFTTRAKELQELYEGLMLTNTSVDDRLDVLLHVKWTVKEFDCQLTRDLVDLIDREADLLNRGRSEKAMLGLRKRIATLFLQFVETPAFNPEAARFQQVPSDLVERPQILPNL